MSLSADSGQVTRMSSWLVALLVLAAVGLGFVSLFAGAVVLVPVMMVAVPMVVFTWVFTHQSYDPRPNDAHAHDFHGAPRAQSRHD